MLCLPRDQDYFAHTTGGNTGAPSKIPFSRLKLFYILVMRNVFEHDIWIAITTIKHNTVKLTLNPKQQVMSRRPVVVKCCSGGERQVFVRCAVLVSRRTEYSTNRQKM